MNADNPDITHSVLTDIYTDIGYNTIHGVEYNEVTGEGNKDYSPDDKKLMGGEVNVQAEAASVQQNRLNELRGKPKTGETPEQMAARLDRKVDDTIWDPDTNQFRSINSMYGIESKSKENKSGGTAR